jgi:hypothetical protein
MWSAVCSQTSMVGCHLGAKMTRGGAIPTSRVPTGARSASGLLGRQEHGRYPDFDLPNVGKTREGANAEPLTEHPIGGSAGHRHAG